MFVAKYKEIQSVEEKSLHLEFLENVWRIQPLITLVLIDADRLESLFAIIFDIVKTVEATNANVPFEFIGFGILFFHRLFFEKKNKSYFVHETADKITLDLLDAVSKLVEKFLEKIDEIVFLEKFFLGQDRKDNSPEIIDALDQFISMLRVLSMNQNNVLKMARAASLDNFFKRCKQNYLSGKPYNFKEIQVTMLAVRFVFDEAATGLMPKRSVMNLNSAFPVFQFELKKIFAETFTLIFTYKL